jgi:hypothetical protein
MRHSQSLYLLGDTAPAAEFGRIARTIPAPQRLALAATESANAATLTVHPGRGAPGARRAGDNGPGAAVLSSEALHARARAARARAIGDALVSALRRAATGLRAWHERYRRHVDAQAIHRELAGLDSRTLHDLGIHHRGELRFIAHRLAHGEDLHELRGRR